VAVRKGTIKQQFNEALTPASATSRIAPTPPLSEARQVGAEPSATLARFRGCSSVR
jgi:hypothetical protein